MVPALVVVALLVRSGLDNPAILEVPPAVRERAAALVAKLGDRQFAERDAAFRELEGMGRLGLPAVREGRKSPDPEVRVRCDRLAPPMEDADLAARLAVFVADAAGRYDHRVPGWELFRAAAGDDRPARDLFAEITRNRDNWPLLAALRGPGVDIRPGLLAAAGGAGAFADRPAPYRAAQAHAVRRWQFFADRDKPLDEGETRRPGPSLPDVVLVTLADTLYPERLTVKGQLNDFVVSFLFNGPVAFREAVAGKGRYGPAVARLVRAWMDSRDGTMRVAAFVHARRLGIDPPAVRRYAARVVAMTDAPPDQRIEGLLVLMKEDAHEHLGVVLGQFRDPESINGIPLSDFMLAAAVQLSGQATADYGMRLTIANGPEAMFPLPADTPPKDRAAAVAAKRTAAYARWRDWEGDRFGAVAGPAVIAGARPVP